VKAWIKKLGAWLLREGLKKATKEIDKKQAARTATQPKRRKP